MRIDREIEGSIEGELRTVPLWRLILGAAIVSAFVWAVADGFYF
jgi:hypothetical protein